MRLHKDVAQLIQTHGYALTFSRANSGGAYDTATGTFTGGTTVTYTGRGVFVNYAFEDIDGTSIEAEDRKLLLRATDLGQVPQIGDRVDGVQIIRVQKMQSGSTVIAYVCQTRG